MKNRLSSIGNDIIALNQTNTHRTLQKRFYSRILSAEEVALFNDNDFKLSFESFIWLSWSIKESVFKFIKRHQPKTKFSPTKIIITKIKKPQKQTCINSEKFEGISFYDDENFCCEILYNNQNYYTRSFVNDNFIFTVANNTDCFTNIFWGIQNIDNDSYTFQTQMVRTFVLERLQQQFETEHLQIEKSAVGFPLIVPYHNLPLSFTHHGNFVGYSFLLEDGLN